MKRENSYDTHRDYLIRKFIFNDEIKVILENIVCTYRDKFLYKGKKEKYIQDKRLLLRAVPLLEELKAYYNNDVCVAVVTGIAVSENTCVNLRTHAFYFKSAIYRIANA